MKSLINLLPTPACNVYTYGSRVYGTQTEQSDEDYIVISDDLALKTLSLPGRDLHVYTPSEFSKAIEDHEIWALESLNLPPTLKHETIPFYYQLDLRLLRTEISSKSSNSWVKAKKKIEKEKDFYLGEKSLWHSLRIIDFGIQLARSGKITDFQSMNSLYPLIVNQHKAWAQLQLEFKSIFNQKHSEFKKNCPKG